MSYRLATCALIAAGALSGCAHWVKLDPGADNVNVADASAVGQCTPRGTISVSVLDKVGFVSRDPVDVDKELATLARNSAHTSGYDTVVSDGPEKDGNGTFHAYTCRK
ncbi:MAG: DUF4156 domain-containing protein [Burkholderiales bacterium]|nr:DUF4156 domain-containing protein [Burkholderiales bacterium]